MRTLLPHTRRRAGTLLLLALVAAGCSSTGKRREPLIEDLGPQVFPNPAPEPIGKFLADLDTSIRDWTTLTHTARTSEERRMARLLELDLNRRAYPRRDELVEQLETGPPYNRVRAATALGFTRAVEAQSPLLAALEDPDPDVVHNALLGLALLERPDTPLERIAELAARDADPHTRGNAAYALRSIVQAGGRSEVVLPAARLGLADPEPLVRVQSALTLGVLGDEASLQRLADLAHDPTPLVRQASLRAIVLIGEEARGGKGPAARALTAMLAAPGKDEALVRRSLIELAGIDYGKDLEPWVEWANRLP